MLDQTVLAEFKLSLAGELIQPGEQGYDEARQAYNGMIDRRPRLIVRCVDVADVIAAVNFGRRHRMLIAVRCGGHNAGGLGVCDDCLVIDLSLINYTRGPQRPDSARGGRVHVVCCRPRDARVRFSRAHRLHFDYWRGWIDARRWAGLPRPQAWPDHRQPALR
jgi:FAD binding domain